MTFLPVVERELRAASRRSQTFWRRTVAGLIATGLCGFIWMVDGGSTPPQERGQEIFYTLAGLAFGYSLLAGVGATADSLSEEKREGTLGLLFLTDLRGYDVVLGKLAASSLSTAYRLAAVMPILAIPILMGSVTLGDFWRIAIVLLNTLMLSLSAGMLASAMSRQSHRSVVAAFGWMTFLSGGMPLLALILSRVTGSKHSWLLANASPFLGFGLAFDTPSAPFRLHEKQFWIATCTTHFLVWLFLIIASVVLPRTWHDQPAAATRQTWRDRLRAWGLGSVAKRASFRARLLEINPFFWLASRDFRKPFHGIALVALVALGWLVLWFKYPGDMVEESALTVFVVIIHTALKCWLATEACRRFCEDRRSGALELLLSTPLNVPGILRGQMLALNRHFSPVVGTMLVIDLVIFISKTRDRSASGPGDWALSFLSIMVMFVGDLYTLSWLGMWFGLVSRSPHRAASAALVRVLVLPWVLYILGMITILFLSPAAGNSIPSTSFMVGIWMLLGLGMDFYFANSARRNLTQHFHLVVAQQFTGRKVGLFQTLRGETVSPQRSTPGASNA
ncbi:MAG: ABC transporter permease [Pedosphaera sp.]|nr:ABC transporter permease [Pedosphaera sp.]